MVARPEVVIANEVSALLVIYLPVLRRQASELRHVHGAIGILLEATAERVTRRRTVGEGIEGFGVEGGHPREAGTFAR